MTQPLTPAECDLRGMSFMPLDVLRLRDSDLSADATGDEFRAAVLLWCACWHQLPAASLPEDEKILAHLAGYGRAPREWKKVREGALRGFVKCSDGRLYHPVIAEKAKEAWAHRLKQRAKAAKRWDREKPELGNAAGDATALPEDMQGTGTGTGTVVPLGKPNGRAEPDADQIFWEGGKAFIQPEAKGDPGALIGKWCRDYGKEATAQAITRAQLERPAQRIPFIVGRLKRERQEGSLSVPC